MKRLRLFTANVGEQYAGGMAVIAAFTAERAKMVLREHVGNGVCWDTPEEIVGATYHGEEGVLRCSYYAE